MRKLIWDADENSIAIRPYVQGQRLFSRLMRGRKSATLDALQQEDHRLAMAIGDLEALADETGETLEIAPEEIRISHHLAALLPAGDAEVLGLPRPVHLTLAVDVEGIPGSSDFQLQTEWRENGRRVMPRRIGAILHTSDGPRLLPSWMLGAIEAAEALASGTGDEEAHWTALGRFRASLELGLEVSDPSSREGRLAISEFLRDLEIRIADRFSLSPRGDSDFDIVPFDSTRLREAEPGTIGEDDAELVHGDLAHFQARVRERGALSTYRIGRRRYLVIDPRAQPALRVMAEMQRAEPEERKAFLHNPRPRITAAVEAELRKGGRLDGLSEEGVAEAIEATATPLFVETREYSERVLGIAPFSPPVLPADAQSPITWMPEDAGDLMEAIASWSSRQLREASDALVMAMESGEENVCINDVVLPAVPVIIEALRKRASHLEDAGEEDKKDERIDEQNAGGKEKLVLQTLDNIEELKWNPAWKSRRAVSGREPLGLRSSMHLHQREAFDWQVEAWLAGAPGVLNADEQGLGKTFETLAFLRWLSEQPAGLGAPDGPVLIVAPTSLLETWIEEARTHLDERGLGELVRVYGSGLKTLRKKGAESFDIATGEEQLDLSPVHVAISEERGRQWWLITTYDTLVNYQHSLGRIPFAAVVFDEAQAIKNPATLRHQAARALNADFRIALTGTPIENRSAELWAIMDVIAPGALGDLSGFLERFGTLDSENACVLHRMLFEPASNRPAIAIRRLKEDVAKDLPSKTRRLHPALMPPVQAMAYEAVRAELAGTTRGSALKLLHRIRSTSLHPNFDSLQDGQAFIEESARLKTVFRILRDIRAREERALIFLESRKLQYRLARLISTEFGLERVEILNGSTPIDLRKRIVSHFQRHLKHDEGFDLLILGPRAAGTGLTLTAAQHVIHLSRWWNPAVEEQCNDRIHRIGQEREVQIHIPLAIHPRYGGQSFDCHLQVLMMRKQRLARAILWPMGDSDEDVTHLVATVSSSQAMENVCDPFVVVQDLLSREAPKERWHQEDESFILV